MHNVTGSTELICAWPQVYQHSAELQLAQRLFLQALPGRTEITLIDDGMQQNQQLYQAIRCSRAEYIVLAKEPGIMVSADGVAKLQQILQQCPQVTGVLAADLRDHVHPGEPPYLSLYGFEEFTKTLPKQCKAYDQRPIELLVGKTAVLQEILRSVPADTIDTPLAYLEKNLKGLVIAEHVFIHAFFDYYQQQRAELLPLIPGNLNNMLDIGCARGEFGALVKRELGCRVVGIEYNSSEAKYARQHLDDVFSGDVMSQSLDERFDCVSCLDTLEHFDNAEGLLAIIARRYLKENGYLLLSLPNVGHWSVTQDLLAGRWDYVPAGILCNTHLRFFTLHTIKTMLDAYGFKLLHVSPVSVSMPERFRTLADRAEQAGITVNRESLDTLAFHLLAQKQGR